MVSFTSKDDEHELSRRRHDQQTNSRQEETRDFNYIVTTATTHHSRVVDR